ncbi:transducin-like enhancer protein 4 [Caerostris extrusa]|uniref:Transducin-like enhancer protein 4 n=1 Tax=Caerostris extrusa TaxID=172846 RepID=A0AAV4M434_CAEEX|nr:transducin-like enhancer protein 4 [Caerostris extrusa]
MGQGVVNYEEGPPILKRRPIKLRETLISERGRGAWEDMLVGGRGAINGGGTRCLRFPRAPLDASFARILKPLFYSFWRGPPPQAGQPFKFTVAESCDRIKEEFSFLQAQYHNLKLECEKLASEKTEMQRHYVMYYEMSYGLNVEMHKQKNTRKYTKGFPSVLTLESSLAVSIVVYLLSASSTKKIDYNPKSPAIHLHKRGKETAGLQRKKKNALVTYTLALILGQTEPTFSITPVEIITLTNLYGGSHRSFNASVAS